MKKVILPILIIFCAYSAEIDAQVGLNTANPAVTLDVTAKAPTGTSKTSEGLLIPRVDRERAQNMTGVPVSTLVYINSVSTGTPTGTTVNVDAAGYYYYDGTAWIKLNSATGSAVNIYNTDGSLTANRTVTQADKTLAFTGTATNAFSVDGQTFSIDAANDRVGIGTPAPQYKLDIRSANYGWQHTDGTVAIRSYIGQNAGWIGTSSAHGMWFMTGDSFKAGLDASGNFGIGTKTPAQKLHVEGAARITGSAGTAGAIMGRDSNGDVSNLALGSGLSITGGTLNVSSSGGSANIYTTDGTLTGNRTVTQAGQTLAFTGTAANAFSVDGPTFSVNASNDRVGIGTTSPATKLHVEGSGYFNGPITATSTKNVLDLNIGQDGVTWGNRADNFGIMMRSNSSGSSGPVSRINFGDTSTTNATGNRYLSFSVGKGLNELMYLTDANNGRVGIGTTTPNHNLDLGTTLGRKLALYSNAGNDFYGLGVAAYVLQLYAAAGPTANPIMTLRGVSDRVGIGTGDPQKKLHVVGDLQVTNELNVGGDAATAGSAGTSGQILTSKGPGAAPAWQDLSTSFIPKIAASGRTTSTQTVSGGGTFRPYNFQSVGTNDGHWNSSNNTYTVATAGYYQLSMTSIIKANQNNNTSNWSINVDGQEYVVADFQDMNVPNSKSKGGTIVLYLNVNSTVRFGSNHCLGCHTTPETYDISPGASFAILALGT